MLIYACQLSHSGTTVPSLTWPDRYFCAGAYRLEIISACTKRVWSSLHSQSQQHGVGCLLFIYLFNALWCKQKTPKDC